MKWNELQEKARVNLLVDLRVISKLPDADYVYLTPSDLDLFAPVVHTKGSWFTVYHNEDQMVELFNEATDDVLFVTPEHEIPCHFVVL